MIHVITEQSWSTLNGNAEGQHMGPPRMVGFKASREEAEVCACALSAQYHHHGYVDGECCYWWGREKEGHEIRRFVVRPATP
jgi:6-phosphogluconate dehydrogenase